MATQRFISTSFWTDKWIRSLDPSERYLYMYLLTNPQTNIAGVYQITIDRIAFDTGYDERTLTMMLSRFEDGKKAYFYDDEWVIIPSWPKHQKADSKPTIKKGIDSLIKTVPDKVKKYMISIGYQYDIIGYEYQPSYSDSDTDLNSDTDIDLDINATPSNNDLQSILNYWNNKPNLPKAGMIYNLQNPSACLDAINGFGTEYIKEAIDTLNDNRDEIGKYCPDFSSLLTKGKIGYWHDWKGKEKEESISKEDMVI